MGHPGEQVRPRLAAYPPAPRARGAGSGGEASRRMQREGLGLGRGAGGWSRQVEEQDGPWCCGKWGEAWLLGAVPCTPRCFAGTSWRSRLRRGGRGAGELSSGGSCPLLSIPALPSRTGQGLSLLSPSQGEAGTPGHPGEKGTRGRQVRCCSTEPRGSTASCTLHPHPKALPLTSIQGQKGSRGARGEKGPPGPCGEVVSVGWGPWGRVGAVGAHRPPLFPRDHPGGAALSPAPRDGEERGVPR